MSFSAVLTAGVEADAVAAIHDQEALTRLYDRYCDPVFNYLLVCTQGDRFTAEDLSQCTWERVARKISTYQRRGEGGFAAWLVTVAKNVFLDHFRRTALRPYNAVTDSPITCDDPIPEDESPELTYERKARSNRLAAAVGSLSRAQRQCVELRFMVGLSLAETAQAMNRTPDAVKQLQFRACKALRKSLAGDDLLAPPPGVGNPAPSSPRVLADGSSASSLDLITGGPR